MTVHDSGEAVSVQPPVLVVGAGVPPGALDAVRQMLAAVPPRCGITFLLVQPSAPARGPIAASDLAPATSMPVREARHGLALERDTVYIAPPDAAIGVRDGAIDLPPDAAGDAAGQPLAHLFRSLATELGASAAGIVLSTSSDGDGSDGLRALRSAGGLTIAQAPPTADGDTPLPDATPVGAQTDVDLLLPIAAMPGALVRFSALPPAARGPASPDHDGDPGDVAVSLSEPAIGELAAALEGHAGFDLRMYKTGTVQRRVFRRMSLTGHSTVDSYLACVREHPHEQQALVRDLLISVTRFFRDPEAYALLRRDVIDPLVDAARPGDTLRAWVAGCATGEEAYSLAIELFEAVARRGVRLGVQIFATDVDHEALAMARTGVYPPTLVDHVPAERLGTYFVPVEGRGYQVSPLLRDAVSFAAHDVTRDPPFSRMHLVSCRNLLIYLRPPAQEHVLRVLHYALLPGGTLFLGSSESTTNQHELFSTISKRWRLYRKVGRALPRMVQRGGMRQLQPLDLPSVDAGGTGAGRSTRQQAGDLARRLVLQSRVPPTVVVGAQGTVLFMHGELRPYLRFPDGDPRFEIAALVDPDLATRVRAALYRCRRDRETVVAYSSPEHGRARRVRIAATPAFELGDDAVILTFEDVADTADEPAPAITTETTATDAVLEQLERELIATREDLRNTVEELEASNEELRSSHEESTSMNEELQSANEELEATAEELTTLNAQLREKVEQLEHANDDLTNFFESSRVATLFLDERLCIRRFTPAAAELLRIGLADTGRFIGDIARELLQEGLIADARDVMAEGAPLSRELHTREMRWLLRRVLPYRSERGPVEGVVVTFSDVTEFKLTASRLATSEQQQATIAQLGMVALEEPDLQAFFERTVQSVRQTLRADLCGILELQPSGEVLLLRAGVGWREGAVGDVTVPRGGRSHASFALASDVPVVVHDLSSDRRFTTPPLLDEHEVRSSVSCVIERADQPYGLLGVHSRTSRRFTDEDVHFLQAVAAVVAGAIARHATRVRLGLESAVATALSDASSLDAVLADVSRAAAAQFGEGAGEYWQPDADGTPRRIARYPSPPEPDDAQAADAPPPSPSVAALVKRVLASGRAEWATSVRESRPTRLDTIDGTGALRSAVAIPVVVGSMRFGVLVHLSRKHVHADRVLLQSLETIGRTLGDCGERLDASRRLTATVDGAPVGIADRALDGRWLRVNDRLCDITGYSREELVGRPFREFVHPDDYDRERTLAEELGSGARNRYAIEKRYVRRGGQTIWVLVSASLVRNPSGRPEYTVVVVEDISARKRAERELRLSESRFRDVLRGSPVPMMLQDEHGRVLAVSDSWAAFTGFTPDDTPTFDDWVRQACVEGAGAVQALRSGSEAPETPGVECDIRTKHGETRTVQLSVMPLAPGADGLGLRLATVFDLTAQRAYEREVEHASQQKDEFIAMLSHELRNPLAAIRSATEVLKRADHGAPGVRHAQQVLERQSTHMARLLDGLLDISRIVLGRIDVIREPLDLCALVQEAAGDARELAAEAGLTLTVECTSAPAWVLGDAVRLTQALDNLLGNARKFTPSPGTIHVALDVEGTEAVVRVRDSGIGIEPTLLPRVFEVFRQGAQHIDRSRGGLGLGLALVKLLVERQGGTVSAASDGEGRGAEFTIRLPLAEAPGPHASHETAPTAASRRVLVVEDSEDGAEMMKLLLEQLGHQVLTATRGADAIEAARQTPLDIVLCDLGLPDGVTGYDVARALRADDATRHIRLVALTGYGRPEDRARTAAAGFDEHLTKPVSMDDLERVFRELPAGQDE